VYLDDEAFLQQVGLRSTDNPVVSGLGSGDLAYVIYTSGSTGNPKGVMIQHRNTVAFLSWAITVFNREQLSCVLASTSVCFDLSIFEIFAPLSVGGSLLVVNNILDLKNAHEKLLNVSLINTVPSAIEALLAGDHIPKSAKTVNLAGEPLKQKIVNHLYQSGINAVYDLYGPSEDTTYSTFVLRTLNGVNTIGKPISNCQVHLLNQSRQLVGVGVIGEMYIGGAGLARGYLNRPELSAEKFVTNPFYDKNNPDSSERLYKTGDLARWLPDGNLEFLGRVDHQVKIRGFRIELGEIENTLGYHKGVKDVVVVAKESSVDSSDKRLVAYVAVHAMHSHSDSANVLIEDFRKHLRQSLPEYMIPAIFVLLEKLPLTPNGKVDRKALPEPDMSSLQAVYIAPRNDIEKNLCKIWQDLLGVARVGIEDNFFQLGGNSLLTIKLQSRVNQQFNSNILIADIFTYTTIESLSNFLLAGSLVGGIEAEKNVAIAPEHLSDDLSVAIIGMTCRFPDAPNIDCYWENISLGKESIHYYSDEELLESGINEKVFSRRDYVKNGIMLDNLDLFDANYFNFTPREAEFTCPQQRFLLESAVDTLEQAGYGVRDRGQQVGVFIGASPSAYFFKNVMPAMESSEHFSLTELSVGLDKDFIATRISYKLNLTGPSVSIHTACSTSLTAISQACLNLYSGKCELALVGAASLQQLSPEGYIYRDGGILSADGHCRPFDAGSGGTRGGSGVGMVLLKRLDKAIADKDTIHAVIKGVATNNDGNEKINYTAPSVPGQANVIRDALAISGVSAETIQYIETHGTGTKLGDPIEISGLIKGFNSSLVDEYCALGSVKANIGHLDVAAGMAGLIKTVQALKNKKIPPSINFDKINPLIDLKSTPFYINTTLKDWVCDSEPRRAGLSSFGIGGTNAHAILEEAPATAGGKSSRQHGILPLSAKTKTSVITLAKNLMDHLVKNKDINLVDAEFSLQAGREHHRYRHFVIYDSVSDAIQKLEKCSLSLDCVDEVEHTLPIVFMFPGQGAEYVGMAKDLYFQEPVFKEQLDICAEFLLPELSIDIRSFLQVNSEENSPLLSGQTNFVQPLLFAIEYSLAQLWMSWGVRPSFVIGHSVGEYVAACLSGVFSLKNGLKLISHRGRLMQTTETGKMISVLGAANELIPYVAEYGCELAAINSPKNCVISGSTADIQGLEKQLGILGFTTIELKNEHAFHSKLMDSILNDYRKVLESVSFEAQQIPVISNLSGKEIDDLTIGRVDYWLQHLRKTVDFSGGITTLLESGRKVFLEVGPGTALSSCVRKHAGCSRKFVITSLRGESNKFNDVSYLLGALGELWKLGVNIDWSSFHKNNVTHRIPLPTYPFERKSYWIDKPYSKGKKRSGLFSESIGEDHNQNLMAFDLELTEMESIIIQVWQKLFGIRDINVTDSFFDLGGDSLLATRLMNEIRDRFSLDIAELPLKLFLEKPFIANIAHEISIIIKNKKLQNNRKSINSDFNALIEEGEI
jgi:polyketide synthase PksJ